MGQVSPWSAKVPGSSRGRRVRRSAEVSPWTTRSQRPRPRPRPLRTRLGSAGIVDIPVRKP